MDESETKKQRASITDPEIRKMKMGDGGYRQAYNVQFATGTVSRVIYGVDVVNTLDPNNALRMMLQVHQRIDKLGLLPPKHWIADAAYANKEDIESVAAAFPNCKYYAPAQVNKHHDPKKEQKKDSNAMRNWRASLDSEEMKAVYKQRPSAAEFSNAQTKNMGMRQFLVRGLRKVTGMAILHAIAHNVVRYWHLKQQLCLV